MAAAGKFVVGSQPLVHTYSGGLKKNSPVESVKAAGELGYVKGDLLKILALAGMIVAAQIMLLQILNAWHQLRGCAMVEANQLRNEANKFFCLKEVTNKKWLQCTALSAAPREKIQTLKKWPWRMASRLRRVSARFVELLCSRSAAKTFFISILSWTCRCVSPKASPK